MSFPILAHLPTALTLHQFHVAESWHSSRWAEDAGRQAVSPRPRRLGLRPPEKVLYNTSIRKCFGLHWGMSRRPIPIKVKSKDLSQIGELLRGGIQQVRVVVRALSLRQLADGFTAPQVAQALPLTAKAVRQIAHRYISDGLGAAVYAKRRPGAQEVLDGPQKQRIVAMVCSQPPEGRGRWPLRLD